MDESKKHIYHLFSKWFLHGANWTFIVWGVLNALYFLPLLLAKNRNYLGPVAEDKVWPNIKEASMMIGTLGLQFLHGYSLELKM